MAWRRRARGPRAGRPASPRAGAGRTGAVQLGDGRLDREREGEALQGPSRRNGLTSTPRARSWSSSPSAPKRATSADRGSSATAPIWRSPNRRSRARTSGSEVSSAGSGARNAASPPGRTMRGSGGVALPAATVAVNRVPAMPGPGDPGRAPARTVTSRATISGSEPHRRSSPSTWISSRPKAGSAWSATPARPGLKRARASNAASTLAASSSGSGSRNAASGASRWALPSGIPRRTPSARAAGSASITVPSVHGWPPRTTGRSVGKESEWRALASRSGRWGQ